MERFVYTASPSRIVFGADSIDQLPAEIERLGATRALVLCTPNQREQAQAIADRLPGRIAGIFDEAAMHVPIETARKARALASELKADCALAVGGGSTIGLGKAIALESGLPIIAVPTTYAGSEATPIYGITEAGLKKTGRDARVLPRVVIYDPGLTLSLPLDLTVTSAINAMAHAAEGLYAHDGNPVISLMAEEGIRACAASLQPLRRTRATCPHAARPSTAPGCAARCSAPCRWACTTSCATRWAAPSICRMRRCTPWFFRMRWRTTRARRQRPWRALQEPWEPRRRPWGSSNSQERTALPCR